MLTLQRQHRQQQQRHSRLVLLLRLLLGWLLGIWQQGGREAHPPLLVLLGVGVEVGVGVLLCGRGYPPSRGGLQIWRTSSTYSHPHPNQQQQEQQQYRLFHL